MVVGLDDGAFISSSTDLESIDIDTRRILEYCARDVGVRRGENCLVYIHVRYDVIKFV